MDSKMYGYTAAIITVLGALAAFVLTLKVSNFFIAPVEYRRKSKFVILMLMLSMAGGVAFWVFFILVSVLTGKK